VKLRRTPVQLIDGIYVKREDLCSPAGWPKFSKCRGVLQHIRERDEETIGVLDTAHSQAGWVVAAVCKLRGKRCVNFYPHFKAEARGHIRPFQKRAEGFGARLFPLQAGRSAILYHQAKKELLRISGDSYLMPNALKLTESVEETAQEAAHLPGSYRRVIIPVSSGTIAAGVLLGLSRKGKFPRVYLHLGYSRSHDAVIEYVQGYAPDYPVEKIKIIDEGYKYKDSARGTDRPKFPCNEFYDLKTWQWLRQRNWSGKTLFWNIGA